MHTSDLQRYREALQAKRTEILSQETPPLGSGHFSAGDFGDQSNENHDAYVGLRLRQTDGKLLRAIDEAILRIERHTYGICEMCGEEIPSARLKAVPWTRLCVSCKESKDEQKKSS
ncbi:MAG TPA: TraR/DksA family transcriptional regulator [Acidobacteriota bacterium]|jgi:DnaK suppressor protein|nr:TraR/DksA family transcriptional regulator [Acidobacteriota bacterium]